MSAATIALLIQLAPTLLQAGVAVGGNLHADIIGQQAVQVAYYQAQTAYWNAQRRCCCKVKAKRK